MACSRILVQCDVYNEFVEKLKETVSKKAKLSNPLEPCCTQGPIVDSKQLARVISYIEEGKKEGAKCVLGGIKKEGKLVKSANMHHDIFSEFRLNSLVVNKYHRNIHKIHKNFNIYSYFMLYSSAFCCILVLYVHRRGLWVEPTIFTDVTDEMKISREEIFGPVVCVYKFKTVEEAVRGNTRKTKAFLKNAGKCIF